ncbi:MAG: hypothetical protein DHS20C15_17560 [Planctomycetota bacterium]|nr:MAG: hypothetical protein DHS20C15_17560 [Planctomycetota bacterium]
MLSCLVGLSTAAAAQQPQPPTFAPREAARAFQERHGENWRVRFDGVRGVPEHIFGSQLQTTARGDDDASLVRAARTALRELTGATGVLPSELELVQVKRMQLSRGGTSDKISVKFRQLVSGVVVHGGVVHVLFDASGKLLSIDNQALPQVRGMNVVADVNIDRATAAARAAFQLETGLVAQDTNFDDYVIWGPRIDPSKAALPTTAAYVIRVSAPTGPSGSTPADRSYVVASRGSEVVLDSWSNVHSFDLDGNIKGWAQAGLLPDGVDPEVLQNLKDVRVSASGEPDVFTDANGNFTFPGVNSTKTVTARLDGQFSTIDNQSGGDLSLSTSVSPGVFENIVLNAGMTETQTAELNAHMSVNEMRDYLKSVDPTATELDFQIESNVNIGLTCNAFYNGVSLNYYVEGESATTPGTFCRNTAYSTVAYHEEGHWLNDLFDSTNHQFGMGEGGADVWAMYASDNPIVGEDFRFDGAIIRTGENMNPFCGDDSLGCYGSSPHANGQPLMGAIWKVRRNLKNTLGDAAGIDVADQLMVGWYQAFDDTFVRTTIQEHWLVLDDDNGDLSDGTPHFAPINAGFVEQGFPSFQLPIFEISHAPIAHVRHEGKVRVQATITEEAAAALTGAVVHYSNDGGDNFSSVAMTDLGGDLYQAFIPGVASPDRVAYFIEAQSASLGNVTFPKRGADRPVFYDVGTLAVVEFNDFEGATDEGWTHTQLATQDDWQRDEPQGKTLDPGSAFSGNLAWGNDLGISGFNGDYQPDVHNALISPSFNLSGVSGSRLRFQRWLSVEESEFDQARVLVDGNTVWENPFAGHITDAEWIEQDIDISALADGDSNVTVSFELETDGGLHMGGWNIDDFSIVSLTEVEDTSFTMYGAGTPGTSGVAVLDGSGQAVPGGPINLTVTGARPNAFGALFVGTDMISVMGLGGTVLVGNVVMMPSIPTSAAGSVNVTFMAPDVIDPMLDGLQITQQYWFADPGGAAGKAATQGLAFQLDVL